MRSFLVIGLGRFGSHLARRLMDLGNEVMAVDIDEKRVDDISADITRAQIGDCMNPEVIKSLGPSGFDVCFVCIGENFQASLEITWQLKEYGAGYVVAKSNRDIHAKFLRRVGADDVIYPEQDMAKRAAVKYSTNGHLDYFELGEDYALFELMVPDDWHGKDLRNLQLRTKHAVNVIAMKKDGRIIPMIDPEYSFQPGDHLLVLGERKRLLALSRRMK